MKTTNVAGKLDLLERRAAHLRRTGRDATNVGGRLDFIERGLADLKEKLDDLPLTRNITIYDIGHDTYSLKTPLNILVETHEDEIIANFPETEIWASGATESEALNNFKGQLVSVYEDLLEFEKKDELGKLPKMWLKILKRLIKKRS